MQDDLRDVNFFGMLYIAEDREHHANLSDADPIGVYIATAALCARSFAHHGYSFALVTNRADVVARHPAAAPHLRLVEMPLEVDLPKGTPFYSAHAKLALLAELAKGALGDPVGIVDIDTVLQRPFHLPHASQAALIGYDISDQILPTHGRDRVARDLALVAGSPPADVCWWGGEFIVGTVAGIAALSAQIEAFWPAYRAALGDLHHTGDEMLSSAALAVLAHGGLTVADAGREGGLVRWWSARTLNAQVPLHQALDASLLHLPADKPLLAEFGRDPDFSIDHIATRYVVGIRRKLFVRRLASAADRVMRKPTRKIAARL